MLPPHPAAAHGIKKQADLNALLCLLSEYVKKAQTNVVGLHDEELHIYAFLRVLKVFGHAFKGLFTVREDLYIVVLGKEGTRVLLVEAYEGAPRSGLRVYVAEPAVAHALLLVQKIGVVAHLHVAGKVVQLVACKQLA